MLHPVVATGSTEIFDALGVASATGCVFDRRTVPADQGQHRAIRYYERIEMLPPPPRTASGRRVYVPAETRALSFIRRARELGFTLGEIRALLALSGEGASESCAEVRELAAAHLAEIRGKIADLKAMERVLADAVERCDAGEAPGCPVLDALSAA